MEHIPQPLPEDFEEKKRQSGFMEAKLSVENARREAEVSAEQERRAARPAHIKAQEEIEWAISDGICGCQDTDDLEEKINRIFRKYYGDS